MPWLTLSSAKIVYAPPEDTGRVDKDGEPILIFRRIGIRVETADGSWWFQSRRTGTWTRHWMAPVDRNGWDGPERVERKESFSHRQLAANPALLAVLTMGVELANDR
jgi:hypothetical protein